MTRHSTQNNEQQIHPPAADDGAAYLLLLFGKSILAKNERCTMLLPTGEYVRVQNDSSPVNAQELLFKQAYWDAEQSDGDKNDASCRSTGDGSDLLGRWKEKLKEIIGRYRK